MLILAMDTSSAAITAAVGDGSRVLGASSATGAQLHGELLAGRISAALRSAGASPADLTHIVVGVGPGPFTGLRVGIACGAAMGVALGIPVHGVCSLDAVARSAGFGDGAVVSDARRKEVYLGVYSGGRRVGDPHVLTPQDAARRCEGLRVVGAGVALYPEAFPGGGEAILPDAGELAAVACSELGGELSGELGGERSGELAGELGGASGRYGDAAPRGVLLAPQPLYLRRPDAVESAARKRVTP